MKVGRKLALNVSIRQVGTAIFLAAIYLLATLVFAAQTASAAQTVPYKINFQGRLTNSSGNAMADGSYNMKFRLFSVDTGGSHVWEELRETTNRVTVTNGLFSVQLGDVTALSPSVFTSYPLYFEIELPTTGTATCSTASCATFNGTEIMTPRRAVGATPYAMNADTLDGIDATTFARQDQANTFTAGQLVRVGSATAFQVQNASNNEVLTVDTSANKVTLGKASTLGGSLVFANSSNANLVTLVAGVTTGSGYQLTLPTAVGNSGDCLKDTTGAGVLGFGSCSAGGGDNITIGGSAATDANFLNTTATGTVSGVTWTLNAGSTPDDVSISIGNASDTVAGAVTTGTQTFAGAKTFNNGLTFIGDTTLNAQADLRFADANSSNFVAFQAAANVTSNITWTLPATDAAGCLKSDGSGTLSFAACGDTNVQTFAASGNYTVPTNALMVIIEAWGGGGGGGGGTGNTLAATRSGGGGGGGGSYNSTTVSASTLGIAGATVPVTIGTAGTAGSGGSNAVGTAGGAGGATCLSTTTACAGTIYLQAYGGGGGGSTGAAGHGGGGGGGTQAAGATASVATGGAGGGPLGSAAGLLNSGAGGGGGATAAATAAAGGSSNFGGGGGGASTTAGANPSGDGGGSNQGGAGGGAGGSCAVTTCTLRAGGAGGRVPGLSGGGGTAGSTAGQAGGPGNAGAGSGGDGGGGGATITVASGVGGAGGAGGARGGGGGGGGASAHATGTKVGGAGGAGGAGYLRAWTLRGQGADLAEIYCTNDVSLIAGDAVSIDPQLQAGVHKTAKAYDPNAIGVISTNPGLVIGDVEEDCAKPVLVALAGRVPVAVSLENGPIKPGDQLTASSSPGVAMKATKSGTVIGQAMTGYDGSLPAAFVVAFVQNHQSNGQALTDFVPGLQTDSDIPISRQALEYLVAFKDNAINKQAVSEITTDRLTAGLEIISPSVITDALYTNSIGSAGVGDISFVLDGQNKLVVRGKSGGPGFTVDATGNALFGVSLTSLGEIESRGGLKVIGDALFDGKATFKQLALFENDIEIRGRTLFNKDAGGLATIPVGGRRVAILFEKPYTQRPIVTASLLAHQNVLPDGRIEDSKLKEQRLFNSGYTYLISDASEKGFTIVLNKDSTEELQFNWNAAAINDATNTVGKPETAAIHGESVQ